MAKAGSWFGLPDFGITEKFGFGTYAQPSGGGQVKSASVSSPKTPVGPRTMATGATGAGTYGTSWNPVGSSTTSTPTSGGTSGGGGETNTTDPNHVDMHELPDGTLMTKDAYNSMRGQLSGAWDQYFSDLDQQIGGLEGQEQNQLGILDEQVSQAQGDIDLQRTLGQQAAETSERKIQESQESSLSDLASNLRNSMRAGQVMLGARGAGDSSAANMMSYALTKLGNQNRGDVLSQSRSLNADVQGRVARMNEIVNNEINKLNSEKRAKTMEIAQWFDQQQNALRQAQAEGRLKKGLSLVDLSKDALNTALAALEQVNNKVSARQDALTQWALSRSENLGQLQQNVQGLQNMQVPGSFGSGFNPQFSFGADQGRLGGLAYGAGNATDDDRIQSLRDLF